MNRIPNTLSPTLETPVEQREPGLLDKLGWYIPFAVIARLLANRKGAIGTFIMLLLVIVAILGPAIAPYSAIELHISERLLPPSSKYWFGTDELGRDILSRVIVGAAISLEAGLFAVFLAALVGTVTGVTAGYLGGWLDSLVMRVWDTLLAFPTIFLAIGIVTILGPGKVNAYVAIAVANMPTFSRLVRSSTLAVKGLPFVEAARCVGCSNWRIMFKTIFPNTVTPLLVQMAIAARAAILVEASLSFLGLGSQPPEPSWGNMLSAAQGFMQISPTYGIFPGVAITLVVVGLSFFADGLQDAIDPRRIPSQVKG
jgi:peptide/nickel transport system permease protein